MGTALRAGLVLIAPPVFCRIIPRPEQLRGRVSRIRPAKSCALRLDRVPDDAQQLAGLGRRNQECRAPIPSRDGGAGEIVSLDSAERDFVAAPGNKDDDSDETVAPLHDGQVMVGEGGELFSRRDLPAGGESPETVPSRMKARIPSSEGVRRASAPRMPAAAPSATFEALQLALPSSSHCDGKIRMLEHRRATLRLV